MRTKTFKQEFLDKKEIINAQFQGIMKPSDLQNDHTFGVKISNEGSSLDEVIKHKWVNQDKPEILQHIETSYKPSLQNNKLKPPKPTVSSNLRLQESMHRT